MVFEVTVSCSRNSHPRSLFLFLPTSSPTFPIHFYSRFTRSGPIYRSKCLLYLPSFIIPRLLILHLLFSSSFPLFNNSFIFTSILFHVSYLLNDESGGFDIKMFTSSYDHLSRPPLLFLPLPSPFNPIPFYYPFIITPFFLSILRNISRLKGCWSDRIKSTTDIWYNIYVPNFWISHFPLPVFPSFRFPRFSPLLPLTWYSCSYPEIQLLKTNLHTNDVFIPFHPLFSLFHLYCNVRRTIQIK